MEKIDFNQGWLCFQTGKRKEAVAVTLPHDAMLWDTKSEDSPGGVNTGWYDAKDYTYEKAFHAPEEWMGRKILAEFEGVYREASVYINEKPAVHHSYGYTGFYADLTENLRIGEENVIRVDAVNQDQPNSRWYSGTGIFRPVWLHILPQEHVIIDSIRITTLDWKKPKIKVEAKTNASGEVKVEILDEQIMAGKEIQSNPCFSVEIELSGAEVWEPAHPKLYTCRITFGEDVREERFGIRMISCSPEKGFCINEKRVILKGACIHHDNGILGACAYEFAEYRKIRLLKEGGYNAIRSAHNPCSKALLRACDELGMLVVDEYADMWYIHKTQFDYASKVEENYAEDLKAMVDKDYNHPSVIMYSTGNEVSETAQKRGIELCGKMTKRFHELDSTRPVTCGVNIFFNFLSSMGLGVYSDKKAEKEAKGGKRKAVGSEFFNNLAGFFGSGFMKFGATLYPCDLKTKDAFANMDVAGYNYGIRRYRHDLKKYPERLILGSETFCSDVCKFLELAEKEQRILGDFVWAGMDYLGETGIGAQEYKEYAPRFDHGYGWLTAGAGRYDLTGKPLAELKYTKVALGMEKIGIGVIPVNHTKEKHSPSAWRMTNAVESWSWNGCSGEDAKVEVYARADHVSLYINGKCVGTKKSRKNCRVIFNVKYQDGEVTAVAYDRNECIIAETSLVTAGEETKLLLEPEQPVINRQTDLCYVRLRYTDQKGILKPLIRGDIHVTVEGGELLGLGSACPYYPKGYLDSTADTYYGEALAVIRPSDATSITVKAVSEYGEAVAEIPVEG
ncbi:MAG: glycoside hydrolase family 2 TIM barrel-domain containing protein [Bariatricus sp.]